MIEEVFISGQIGKAIYKGNGRYFIVGVEENKEPVECRPADLSLFVNFGAEFTVISDKNIDLDGIRDAL